ncbi:MAG TPA: hypothetical protein VEM96_13465 [Pyrinomonadaceae bacterium]|nr:hypothetical protein [Pyrinomonadaceae bacterium]
MSALDQTQQPVSWGDVVRTTVRLIFFRVSRAELVDLGWRHLAFGLFCTWLVGMGRYWDNPRVGLIQHLGVGSVVYVFVLSLFLWLIILPLRPRHWSYFGVLTFISLVSPPAALYAIPIEKVFNLDTANAINAWFLAVVAGWRVALLVFFLRRLGVMNWFSTMVATLLPLTLIVVTLTVLNLDQVVFDLMGGIRERSSSDTSYGILILLSWLSILLFIPLLICYLIVAVNRSFASRDTGIALKDNEKRP